MAVLAKADPVMAGLISRFGPSPLGRRKPPFPTLVASIVGQQLSSRAAATIHARVLSAAGCQAQADPERLLALTADRLRALGLSRAKARWLHAACEAALDGRLDHDRLDALDDEALLAELTRLPGVGPWTAQMLMIFSLGRLDVFADADAGLRRAIGELYHGGKQPTPRLAAEHALRWRPYRSVASWYLWRYLDGDTTLW